MIKGYLTEHSNREIIKVKGTSTTRGISKFRANKIKSVKKNKNLYDSVTKQG